MDPFPCPAWLARPISLRGLLGEGVPAGWVLVSGSRVPAAQGVRGVTAGLAGGKGGWCCTLLPLLYHSRGLKLVGASLPARFDS